MLSTIGSIASQGGNNFNVYIAYDKVYVQKFDYQGNKIWSLGFGAAVKKLAVDRNGNAFIAVGNGMVYKINPQGAQLWSYNTGVSTTTHIAVDKEGYIYCTANLATIHKINQNGQLVTTFPSNVAYFMDVLTVDNQGAIYYAETDYIYKLNANGTLAWKVRAGKWFYSVTVDELGNSYWGYDSTSGQIIKYDTNGNYVSSLAYSGGSDITIDRFGYLYYCGSTTNRIYKANTNGTVIWSYAFTETMRPRQVAVDKNGFVYVGCDNTSYKLSPEGVLLFNYPNDFISDTSMSTDIMVDQGVSSTW